ncbi:hypothetical protein E8E12_006847 [Didymella heteroderae]|uniref:Uncharacterized protein n=1 Tax=Didymella heteroderae TaxID=1769908 RepID=A0A9P5C066_9PLEO|nr:hypothetical protein E8E12_006847 [Didymella heteroderae]
MSSDFPYYGTPPPLVLPNYLNMLFSEVESDITLAPGEARENSLSQDFSSPPSSDQAGYPTPPSLPTQFGSFFSYDLGNFGLDLQLSDFVPQPSKFTNPYPRGVAFANTDYMFLTADTDMPLPAGRRTSQAMKDQQMRTDTSGQSILEQFDGPECFTSLSSSMVGPQQQEPLFAGTFIPTTSRQISHMDFNLRPRSSHSFRLPLNRGFSRSNDTHITQTTAPTVIDMGARANPSEAAAIAGDAAVSGQRAQSDHDIAPVQQDFTTRTSPPTGQTQIHAEDSDVANSEPEADAQPSHDGEPLERKRKKSSARQPSTKEGRQRSKAMDAQGQLQDLMLEVHEQGWSVPLSDPKQQGNACLSMLFSFDKRMDIMQKVLKSTLIKGNRFAELVGCPHVVFERVLENKRSNDGKSDDLKEVGTLRRKRAKPAIEESTTKSTSDSSKKRRTKTDMASTAANAANGALVPEQSSEDESVHELDHEVQAMSSSANQGSSSEHNLFSSSVRQLPAVDNSALAHFALPTPATMSPTSRKKRPLAEVDLDSSNSAAKKSKADLRAKTPTEGKGKLESESMHEHISDYKARQAKQKGPAEVSSSDLSASRTRKVTRRKL